MLATSSRQGKEQGMAKPDGGGGVHEPWAAGQTPRGLNLFPTPQWAHLLPPFPHFGRPLRLALPCIGIDGASHALKGVGAPFQVDYAFDINASLLRPLATVHGTRVDYFCLGPAVGDILREDITRWHRVDGVVAGPPCQPDSRIGLRGFEADERARVQEQVVHIIADQGRKGAYFFVFEVVEGQKDSRERQGLPSSYHRLLAALQSEAPMYNITECVMKTEDYLPQHRVRTYIVGTNRQFVPHALHSPRASLGPPLQLQDVLALGPEPDIPRNQEAYLSSIKRSDLGVLVQISKAKTGWTKHGRPYWLTLPLDRDMEKTWGMSSRVDGLVETLRTGDEFKWIVRVGEVPYVSRCLHPVERLSLQGFPPALATTMSKRELLLHTGNAFSVPVIGAVLHEICCSLCKHSLLSQVCVPRPIPMPTSDKELAQQVRRARMRELSLDIYGEARRAQSLRRRLTE